MITVLAGENSYEREQELARLVATATGDVSRYDGDTLTPEQLPDIFMGATLFSSERLVIIRGVSDNSSVWNLLPDWLPRASDDTHVVLVEPKPDKRTATWKAIHKAANVVQLSAWTDRDTHAATRWLEDEANTRGITMEKGVAQEIVRRRGVDQHSLHHTLEQLAPLQTVTRADINELLEASEQENVFQLLEASLQNKPDTVLRMTGTLRRDNDPYMTVGLLTSQLFSLAGLIYGEDKPQQEVAKTLGVSPYALRNLASLARQVNRSLLQRRITALAQADYAMKTRTTDPWSEIEAALLT